LDPFQGTVLANFAKDELKATKAYTLGQLGNDYDIGLINYFTEAAKKIGIEVIGDQFPENNSDFNSYITRAKNEGVDVIFAPCSTQYAQLIVEQANAQGVTVPLLAGDTWDSNVILDAAKGKNVKIYVSTFYAEGGDVAFENGFRSWINGDSTNLSNNGGNDIIAAVSVMGYDAYYTALEALKKAGSVNSADVLKVLPNTTYTGVTGKIAFDNQGDAVRDTAYIKTANTSSGVWDFVAVQGIK
jgi:branched-chain amino acid transport system substrate-binding protein